METILEEGCGYKIIRRECGCVHRLRFTHYTHERRAEMGRLSWISACRHCDGGAEGDYPFDIRVEKMCVAHRLIDEQTPTCQDCKFLPDSRRSMSASENDEDGHTRGIARLLVARLFRAARRGPG